MVDKNVFFDEMVQQNAPDHNLPLPQKDSMPMQARPTHKRKIQEKDGSKEFCLTGKLLKYSPAIFKAWQKRHVVLANH